MATNSDLIEKLLSGSVTLKSVNAETRRIFLEKKLNIDLKNISKTILEEEKIKANIENLIGSVQIPLGIAGPITINGEYAKGSFYLPLATSEGALVASVSRGCKLINECGGSDTILLQDLQTRSILFKSDSINKVKQFLNWISNNEEHLKEIGKQDEKFIEIRNIGVYVVGLNIWLRIEAETHEAMGMNMITIAGKKIADYILQNFDGINFISESGNMCVDKKPSALNLIQGRGKKVIASVDISRKLCKKILKTAPEALSDLNYRKNLLGSSASFTLGFNAHFANMISAIFIATGQDAAHVVDGSLGFTTVESKEDGVNFSVTLPDLQIGTVGGGTVLPTQKECLKILGVQGPGNNNSKKLAEIIGAAVLAGEISLLAALATKDLSNAHINLNR